MRELLKPMIYKLMPMSEPCCAWYQNFTILPFQYAIEGRNDYQLQCAAAIVLPVDIATSTYNGFTFGQRMLHQVIGV